MVASPPIPPLEFGEADPFPFGGCATVSTKEHRALDGRGHGRPDEAIEPVVVAAFGTHLPFVHGAAASLGLDPVLGRQVFRE